MATVPGAPGISLLAPDSGKLVVVFSNPTSDGGSPITDYQYQVDSGPIVSIGIYRNPFEITGLTNGTFYNLKLRAVNAEGDGAWLLFGGTPDGTVYYTISRLATSGVNADKARIAFNSATMPGAIEDPEVISLYTGENYPRLSIGATSVTNPFAWTYDASGLLTANGLRWVVGTFTVTDYGSFPVARQIAAAAPTTARNIVVTPGNAQLTVTWIAPISDGGSPVTSYDVKLYIGATLINTYTNVTSPYVITSLTNGTTYNVQIIANNAAGGTASASVSGTPFAPTVPGSPTIDIVTAGDGSITVPYTAPASDGGSPITSYQYSLDGGLNTVSVGLTDPFQITGLTNAQLYTIILRAVNAVGAGAWSAPAYAMPRSSHKVFARGDRSVRIEFDSLLSPPKHTSSTGLKDALNPRTWNVEQITPDGVLPYTVMSVEQITPYTYDILTLEVFPRYNGNPLRLWTAIDGLELEDASFVTISATFNGAIASADATANNKAATKGLVVKDIANVSITPIGSLFGGDYSEFVSGTLVINSAGDYVSVSGEAMVRKLIMRRLLSRKGDFFHLPNYGAGMDIKSVFSTANLRIMAKDIEMQVLLEPEIEAAKATLTYQAANSILIIQVQARMRSTGQQTSLSMSLPLSGTTQF